MDAFKDFNAGFVSNYRVGLLICNQLENMVLSDSSKTLKMTVERLKILQHVPEILYMGIEEYKLLIGHGISLVRKLINDKYNAYQSLLEN